MALLDGKRIVITGSTRGLGRAFAERCAQEGASVVLNGTNETLLAEVAGGIEAHGGGVAAVAGSVADDSVCERIIGTCVERFGGIDVLVNNAGVTRDRTLMKMTPAEFDEVIAVGLRGAWSCARHAAAAMKDSGGHIIQVLSNTGFMGNVGQSNYGAAKAGMAGLLRCWVLELERYGIRCNGIWPLAETDMTSGLIERRRQAARDAGQDVPETWQLGFGAPSDVAGLIVFLASDLAPHLNGQIITSNARKIALWTHPAEVDITVHDEPWTVEELAAHFAPDAGRELPSLYRLR